MFHASSASPPALRLAPVNDNIVSTQRSTLGMSKRLKSSGVHVKTELFDTVSHITIIAAMAAVLRSRAPVLERVLDFVNTTRRA